MRHTRTQHNNGGGGGGGIEEALKVTRGFSLTRVGAYESVWGSVLSVVPRVECVGFCVQSRAMRRVCGVLCSVSCHASAAQSEYESLL